MTTSNLTASQVVRFNKNTDLVARNAQLGTFLSGLYTDIDGAITAGATKTGEETLTNKTLTAPIGVLLTSFGTATLAELNAGKVIVEAVTGLKITPVGFWIEATGAFNSESTGATVLIATTATSPVAVVTMAKAGLTDGGVLTSAVVSANATKGAGLLAAGTAGKAIDIKTNAAFTVGTSIRYRIDYILTK